MGYLKGGVTMALNNQSPWDYSTGTFGASGATGSVLTTGTNGITWQDYSTITAANISSPLYVKGDAEIDGNLKIGGKDLMKTLEKIEQRLNILTVNPELEKRWDELRELGDKYRELEAYIQSKERLVNDLMRDYP